MRIALALVALSVAFPAAAQQLPVPPESRWPTLPRLATKPGFKANPSWIKRAQQLQAKGDCTFKQDRPGWTQVDVPFALQLTATGGVQQVKVGSIDCPALERYVAGLIRRLGPKQLERPRGTPPFWRGSRFIAGWQNDAE